MTIEITSPDVEALILQHMQAGSFNNPEDLFRDVLQQSPTPEASAPDSDSVGRKSLVEVFAPLRGLNLDFSRNPSASRPVDLG